MDTQHSPEPLVQPCSSQKQEGEATAIRAPDPHPGASGTSASVSGPPMAASESPASVSASALVPVLSEPNAVPHPAATSASESKAFSGSQLSMAASGAAASSVAVASGADSRPSSSQPITGAAGVAAILSSSGQQSAESSVVPQTGSSVVESGSSVVPQAGSSVVEGGSSVVPQAGSSGVESGSGCSAGKKTVDTDDPDSGSQSTDDGARTVSPSSAAFLFIYAKCKLPRTGTVSVEQSLYLMSYSSDVKNHCIFHLRTKRGISWFVLCVIKNTILIKIA